jgi:hypothetical protein
MYYLNYTIAMLPNSGRFVVLSLAQGDKGDRYCDCIYGISGKHGMEAWEA